ncbi:hypothetical protein SO802_014898 [Lithocarpus litseifolius]|uniref:Uncharacterized protein n=1 Tax=Lithocarpus litseifolius TaxID=425828 RepID=A0AAW2CS87_9ROSI
MNVIVKHQGQREKRNIDRLGHFKPNLKIDQGYSQKQPRFAEYGPNFFMHPDLISIDKAKRTVRRFVARDEGGGVIRFTEEELNNIMNLTPYAFEKHSGREGVKNWKKHIWVIINDKKVALSKTVLISYYKHSTNMVLSRPKQFHRDEFISCSDCKKLRRFLLRDQMGCRTYHDALANKNWKCTDWPYDKISCDDEEERECRKICKGCPRSSTCRGCTSCVCFGCTRCRFWDCDCRTCVDFMEHGEP